MTLQRWQELAPYVDRALDAGPEGVAAIDAEIRANDPALADQLQAFLAQMQAAGDEAFLEQAVVPGMAHENLADRKLGTTTLLKPIADGGMGQVWLGLRDNGVHQQQVAVKLLAHHVVNPLQRERFQRECRTLAVLRHPNIARLIETGVSPWGQPYLVLELVQGLRIDEGFDKRKLTVHQRVQHFITLVDAVQHAHQHLVVHRDIKPANVLLSVDGEVKLLDFGIAKLLSDEPLDATVTLRANAMLTPGYAAPEQWLGQPVTMATDVYALGVLLYVLLTGRHPLMKPGDTQKQAELATLQTTAPRMSAVSFVDAVVHQRGVGAAQLRQQLRGDLDRIVAKAMHRETPLRYANAAAFADDLRRYLDHRPVLARSPRLTYLLGKFVRRQRVPLALGTAALAAFVMVSTHALQQRAQAQDNASRVATVDGLLHSMFRGMSPDVAAQRTFTAPELLARAQEHLEHSADADAATKRQMRLRLADLYAELGAYEEAIATLNRELHDAVSARDVSAQVAARHRLADAYINRNLVNETQVHLNELERLLVLQPLPDVQVQTLALMLKGELLWQRQQYRDADRVLSHAMARADGSAGAPPAPLTVQARIQHVRGMLANVLGHPRAALQLLQQADALHARRGELGITDRLNMLRDVARAEVWLGRYASATKKLEPALRELDSRLGAQHPVAMDAAAVLLNAVLRQGEFGRAQALVVRLQQGTGAGQARFVAYAQQMHARMQLYKGRPAEAESFFRALMGELQLQDGAPSAYTEPLRRTHGETLLHLGHNEQARAVLQLTHQNQTSLSHAGHVTVAATAVLLGCAHARLGDIASARSLWLQAREVLLRDLGSEHPHALAAEAYVALSSAPPGPGDEGRAELASRIQRDLGWQAAAPALAHWLRQPPQLPDWAALPVVF